MKLKPAILEAMDRDALKDALDRLGLVGADRRSAAAMRARLSRARQATPDALLAGLRVAEIRRVYELMGLPGTGRKQALVQRLLEAREAPPKRPAATANQATKKAASSGQSRRGTKPKRQPRPSAAGENGATSGIERELWAGAKRGQALGLGKDELAFYDALETSNSAVQVLGDETRRLIAWELVRTVRHKVTIDWTRRESMRTKLPAVVKRILNKHGYPPDNAAEAVLEQAEALSAVWAEEPPPALGFRPFPKRGGGVVTDELIDRLREETGD